MLQTVLAERMGFNVSVTYLSPSIAVAFGGIIGAFVLVVPGVHQLGVVITITSVCELGTAGGTARLLRFSRHGATSFRV